MVAPWDRRSAAEQERLQQLLLSQWIPAAASYSPYWAERFAAAAFEPADVDSVEELRRLPPVREADVADAGGEGGPALLMRPTEAQVKATASARTLWEVARRIRSGGVAGKRFALLQEYKPVHVHRAGRDGALSVAYSRSDLDRLHRAGKRAASVLGLDDTDYLVSAVAPRPALAFWGVYHLALGSSMLALHPRASGDAIDAVAAAFRLVPATALVVEIDEAIELAASLVEQGAELARVRTVVVVGPPPSADARGRIAEAFRAAGGSRDLKVLALWAPSEARALWAECPQGTGDDHGSGLHTYPDLEALELVNPLTGRAVGPEGLALDRDGDLTYTSAGWHGTALLRHQTGDYVEHVATEPCPGCGRTVPRLAGEIVPAVWQPQLDDGTGLRRADLRGVAAFLSSTGGVEAWRVELRGPTSKVKRDRVTIEVAADPERVGDLEDQLTAALGIAPTSVKYVDDAAKVQAKVEDVGGVFADLR